MLWLASANACVHALPDAGYGSSLMALLKLIVCRLFAASTLTLKNSTSSLPAPANVIPL